MSSNTSRRSEDRFLRDATRGLSRRARLAAQAELRSHLHERRQTLRLDGVSEAQASAQAMRELGPAGSIARGLRRTEHVHPALSAVAVTALLGLSSLGVEQFYLRDWREARIDRLQQSADVWRDTGIDAAALADLGYVTEGDFRQWVARFGGGMRGHGLNAVLLLPGFPELPLRPAAHRTSTVAFRTDPGLWRLTPYYSQASALADAMQAGWPVQIDGWGTAATIRVNGHSVPTPYGNELTAQGLSTGWVTSRLTPDLLPMNVWPPETGITGVRFSPVYTSSEEKDQHLRPRFRYPVTGRFTPGRVFVLAIRDLEGQWVAAEQPQRPMPMVRVIAAQADVGGHLTFAMNSTVAHAPPIQLYPHLTTWATAPVGVVRPAMLFPVDRHLLAEEHLKSVGEPQTVLPLTQQ